MTKSISAMTVTKAIQMSWASLTNPAILLRILVPVFLTMIISLALLISGWPVVATVWVPFLNQSSFFNWFTINIDPVLNFSLLKSVAFLVYIILVFGATYVFLVLLTSLVLVPLLNPIIHKTYFPQISARSELSFIGSMGNSFKSLLFFTCLFVGLSPVFFLIPGGQIVVSYFLNAFLSRQVFPYDVLQDYATIAEFDRFKLQEKHSLWTLALLTGGYFYMPILNFMAPPLTALAYIFFCLGKISEYQRK